ncbi:MAG TPA: DUF72 domain-containing protein [Candidatus Paceibacterota bacterium]|nr:DUF72 domain-containing protein [Candidatus Paceibacterota bacterium]
MAHGPGKIHIGTSGWMYKDWGESFYPTDMKRGHLAYLARTFDTVEVNSSFYHLPAKSTFEKWCRETPEHFVFSVKLSRYITHEKRIKSARVALERFMRHAEPLRTKLGVVLVQLPPNLAYDKKVLGRFLQDLFVVTERNFRVRVALEPRHKSWMNCLLDPDVRPLLWDRNIALVFPDSAKIPSFEPTIENITADFIYVRFHGPTSFASSRYGPRRLKPWAERIARWSSGGFDVFVYFNNDVHGHAIVDARTLKRQLKLP